MGAAMGTWLLGLGFGLVLWTLLEYVLHRWVFHARVLGRRLAREHIEHHAAVDYFAPVVVKLAFAVPIVGGVLALSALVVGPALGTSVPVGIVVGWLVYEVIHRRIHVAAPRNAYGRWARRNHLLHHFGRADRNHGVTTPIWDLAFGTRAPAQPVKIPRRHATKFPWLVEERGELAIAAPFVAEYRLVGAAE